MGKTKGPMVSDHRPFLIQRVFTAPLFSDRCGASLEVSVSHRAVEIDDRLFHALETVEIERALVDDINRENAEARAPRSRPAERIHEAVDDSAGSVADRCRRHQRKNEVRAALRAPNGQRLAEIFVGLLEAEVVLGDIEKADVTDRAVDRK